MEDKIRISLLKCVAGGFEEDIVKSNFYFEFSLYFSKFFRNALFLSVKRLGRQHCLV